LPYDDGAAPNPFHGVCTLVICKPAIRASARVGDWIAGTGAKYARRSDGASQDMRGRLVYAMRVSESMPMPLYDEYTRAHLPGKIPRDEDDCGDSIYDFSGPVIVQRPGPHLPSNMPTDLRGKNAILSDHFFYFGAAAIELPERLQPIAQNQQGHRVHANAAYVTAFIEWVEQLGHQPCSLLGTPLMSGRGDESCRRWCATSRAADDDVEEEDVVSVPARRDC
jgi:hypothetical protein